MELYQLENDPVIKNWTDRDAIFTDSREIHYKDGDRIYQFTVSNAGVKTENAAYSLEYMTVDLVYQSTENLLTMTLKVKTNLFSVTFINFAEAIKYKVSISQNPQNKWRNLSIYF